MANLRCDKKNKLYKQFSQATNPVQRVNLHQEFKTYRNQINYTESSKQRKLFENVY